MGAKKDPKKDSKTPAKTPKKKEGGGGKAKKKKWSKGKSRDKLNNLVLFDKNTYDKLYKEVPSYKLITPSIVSERLKVRVKTIAQVPLKCYSRSGDLWPSVPWRRWPARALSSSCPLTDLRSSTPE